MINDAIGATAQFLRHAIELSGKSQADIAREAGFDRPNFLSMMKTGKVRVPIARIPALAAATGVCQRAFIRTALAEYQPETWAVIASSFGDVLTRAEQDLLITFRLCDEDLEIPMNAEDINALIPVFQDLVERVRERP